MAFAKGKKQEEPKGKRQPDFVVRAKQSPDSEYWVTIGAAWEADLKDGKKGYSLKINNMPINWNGDALLMPPLEAKE
jgi:uncharacterized protein (DUF736 family)